MTFLTCSRKMPNSNLDRNSEYSEIFRISALRSKCWDNILRWATAASFHILSHSLLAISDHSTPYSLQTELLTASLSTLLIKCNTQPSGLICEAKWSNGMRVVCLLLERGL
jgi:hypothetical protein